MSALLELLSPDERMFVANLRDENRRRRFVVGRAMCRCVLSRYAPVPPEQWRFALGRRGKPVVAAPALSLRIWFNLSHTDEVSVCAVTGAGPEIGIDVERIMLGRDGLEIAEQFFPEVEANALRLMPPAQRGETFVRLWALKESFVKAREVSLADGISGTTFDLACPDAIGVTFDEPIRDMAREWQFRLFQIGQAQIVAVAVRTRTSRPISVRAGTCRDLDVKAATAGFA